MTTEDEFQRILDACPEDHQTRLVFADWLQERGDVRAEGYRALGMLRKFPSNVAAYAKEDFCWFSTSTLGDTPKLSQDWISQLWGGVVVGYWPANKSPVNRREAEDAAARAFSRLPAERRAELLSQPFLPNGASS